MEEGVLVYYTVDFPTISVSLTFPQLMAIRVILPAKADVIRLLAPGESFEHGDCTITREEIR